MPHQVKDILGQLPPEFRKELLSSIREEFINSSKTIIVLDDDPTGTQTCYDVIVLTAWHVPLLVAELKKKPSILFILTNTRSLPGPAAIQRTMEVGRNLIKAIKESGRQIVPISRSDSTLRGHFPAEVSALAKSLNMEDAAWILFPAFIEGGRFTIDDVHYIVEQQELIPVAETPFAKDPAFGYHNSNLIAWIEEKTKGKVAAGDVVSISLTEIRLGGPQVVYEKLKTCRSGNICIVNACSYKDIEVFVAGLLLAEKAGRKFLYRTSATFVPIRAGMASGKIFNPGKTAGHSGHGSLVVVGSYVQNSTRQLEILLAKGSHHAIEIDVTKLLQLENLSDFAFSVIQEMNQWLASGKNVVVYTSRKLEVGHNPESSLRINGMVATFLVTMVSGLAVRPSFIVAKGGITSSDLASKALLGETALVCGQVIPGVPVWKMDQKSKFPGITFVVFPGNVGGPTALLEVCEKL